MQPRYQKYNKALRERQQSLGDRINEVEKSFIDFIFTNRLFDVFNKLNVPFVYDSMFEKCFTDVIDQNLLKGRDYCPTSTECDLPYIYGVECTIAQTSFSYNLVQNMRVYVAGASGFKNVTNGCFHA
uniref:Uncharacterized protein n=1 Tax=Parascaris univalens TaxID=6257 RepID=A0A915A8X7_PARUN